MDNNTVDDARKATLTMIDEVIQAVTEIHRLNQKSHEIQSTLNTEMLNTVSLLTQRIQQLEEAYSELRDRLEHLILNSVTSSKEVH